MYSVLLTTIIKTFGKTNALKKRLSEKRAKEEKTIPESDKLPELLFYVLEIFPHFVLLPE